MTKRPYRLGQRQTATELTRMRIVSAARDLLAAPDGVSGFTVDAVADQSGVARMTVYNQFGSKVGLLEALFDDLAARGLVTRLRSIF
jgi:AcrR family transcriptional regulator